MGTTEWQTTTTTTTEPPQDEPPSGSKPMRDLRGCWKPVGVVRDDIVWTRLVTSHPASAHERPAVVLQRLVFAYLEHEGRRPTNTAVAAAIGEQRSHWHEYVKGDRSPSDRKVADWIDAAFSLGIDVSLTWVRGRAAVAVGE